MSAEQSARLAEGQAFGQGQGEFEASVILMMSLKTPWLKRACIQNSKEVVQFTKTSLQFIQVLDLMPCIQDSQGLVYHLGLEVFLEDLLDLVLCHVALQDHLLVAPQDHLLVALQDQDQADHLVALQDQADPSVALQDQADLLVVLQDLLVAQDTLSDHLVN